LIAVKGKLIFLYEPGLIYGLRIQHGPAVDLRLSRPEFIVFINTLRCGGTA
jgi:hypothetical protein